MPTIQPRRIGSTALEVTSLGLGTTGIANMYASLPDVEARETLDAALAAGIRHFDTAPVYGNGLAETRLGAWLADGRRDTCVISSKVGNSLEPVPEGEEGVTIFENAPALRPVQDFSRDAILRSIDASLTRLKTDRLDMVAIHDPDGSASIEPGVDPYARNCFSEAMTQTYPVLDDLRRQDVIGALGVGMNGWQMLVDFADAGEFDYFLLAGRYTLLEQEAAQVLLPLCQQRGISVVLGGTYNSGILATGAIAGTHYNYGPAPADVLDRVRRIEVICALHAVPLRAAALQFPVAHPAVTSIIPGARTAAEVEENVALFSREIPAAFWNRLKQDGLLPSDAPVPVQGL